MGLRLPGVVAVHGAKKAAFFPVYFCFDNGGAHQALERMQLWADLENVVDVTLAIEFLREVGVMLAGRKPHAKQQPLGTLGSKGFKQFLAQGAKCLGVHQQHAVLVEPDLPTLDIEAQSRTQIEAFYQRLLCHEDS
ncbi:hypothetical protein D3C78_1164960 [compost metagenome]